MNWAIGPEGGSGFNGGDVTRHTAFIVQVNCKEFQKIEALPEPYSVDVKVEQSGNSCPKKTDVTALIKYRKPMTATFRFKVDGKPSEPITIKARKVEAGKPGAPGGPGAGTYYLIERLKTYHLDPGQHNFRVVLDSGEGAKSGVKTVKIDCPPFKVVSTSLDYKVAKQSTCPKNVKETVTATATRPGKAAFVIKTAGGLVVHSGTAVFKRKGMKYAATIKRHNLMMSEFDSDMMADFTDYAANSGWVHLQVACLEALTGKLTLNSLGTTSCQGEALVAIHTNGTGKLPYELECGPGKSWKRKVTAMDNKIGVDKVRFDVTNHEQVTCVLRTRIDGKLKPIDGASKTFQCHRPTDAGATNDFVPETRPDAQGAHNPDKVVIDPPRLPNGPRQPDEVVIDPPRSPSNPTSDDAVVTGGKTEMSCSGGTVRNGECLCPRTHKAVSAGTNAFRCVKSVVIDPVKPGGKQVDSTPDQGKSGAKDSGITDATPDYPKKTRADAEADRKRLEALNKKREEEARKKAEAERKRKEAAKKAAEARSKREAAKKAAEARRKQESAKKAAEARRKREAAKKAAEARRKRQEAQKKAQAAQKKRAEMAKKAEQRRKNGGSKSTPAR